MSNLQQIILETLQGRVLNEDKKKVTIHKDTLVVDVRGKVDLSRKDLFVMPFKFGVIDGHFYIQNNHLNSLEGSPTTVTGGFYCKENKLTSLEGAPKEVEGNFYCRLQKSDVEFKVVDVIEVSKVKGSIYV